MQFVGTLLQAYFTVLSRTRQADIAKAWVKGTKPPSESEIDKLAFLTLSELFYADKKSRKICKTVIA